MPFALRLGTSPLPFKASPIYIEVDGPGFHDKVTLPKPGAVVSYDYAPSMADYKLAIKFHVAEEIVHISVQHLGSDDGLFIFAEPNHPPAMTPGVRFVGTIWHGATEQDPQREHCTVTCEADNTTADCCIICTNGSTTAKICC